MAETKRRRSRKQVVETVAGQEVEVDNTKLPGRPENTVENEAKAKEQAKETKQEKSYVYRDTKGKLNKKVFEVFSTPRGRHTRLLRIDKGISQQETMK